MDIAQIDAAPKGQNSRLNRRAGGMAGFWISK
jgi:hypothetical protein